MRPLHDWQIHSAVVNWESGALKLDWSWQTERHALIATGLRRLNLPREFPWGPSDWIDELFGPEKVSDALFRLEIRVQSGDVIEILAEKFELPPARPMPEAGQLPLGK